MHQSGHKSKIKSTSRSQKDLNHPIIVHNYIASTSLRSLSFWTHRSAPSRKTLEVSKVARRDGYSVARHSSWLFRLFIAIVWQTGNGTMADTMEQRDGRAGIAASARYRPRNVVRRGARVP